MIKLNGLRAIARRAFQKRPIMEKLTHLDERGEANMVDVSTKPAMLRAAVARGQIRLRKATLDLIESQAVAKGNVLATARLAGILAAKKTGELVPLCHPLALTHCEVNFEVPKARDRIVIIASAKVAAQTGVEMEALTAVSIAALTIYDMCKAVDHTMQIGGIKLLLKTKRKSVRRELLRRLLHPNGYAADSHRHYHDLG